MIGTAPGDNGPTSVRSEFDFRFDVRSQYEANGDGSARYQQAYQTIYLDNSANFQSIRVTCFGTLLSYVVPAYSMAILPIACPPGSLNIMAEASSLGAVVPFVIFDVQMPYLVWDAIQAGTNTVARFGINGAAVADRILVGTAPSLVHTVNSSYTRLRNRGANPIYLGGAAVLPSDGFELSPGDTVEIGTTARPSGGGLFAIAAQAGNRLDRLTW